MLSVLLVMLLLSVIVDGTSLVSTNSRLNEVLSFIAENQGSFLIQQRGDHPEGERPDRRPNDPINIETPFSTRFFVLRYNDAGELENAAHGHHDMFECAGNGDRQEQVDR